MECAVGARRRQEQTQRLLTAEMNKTGGAAGRVTSNTRHPKLEAIQQQVKRLAEVSCI